MIFNLELVFDEYAYDEIWNLGCWALLVVGAWIYLKRKILQIRVLALYSAISLSFWMAAIGKWIILPLQRWGAWYGYDHRTHRRFEFCSTIAQWGWVMFF